MTRDMEVNLKSVYKFGKSQKFLTAIQTTVKIIFFGGSSGSSENCNEINIFIYTL